MSRHEIVPNRASQIVPGISARSLTVDFDLPFVGPTTFDFGGVPPPPPRPGPPPGEGLFGGLRASRCDPGFVLVDGRCVPDSGLLDVDPGSFSPAEQSLRASIHPEGHRDTIPGQREVRRRVCPRRSVLGIDGFCHPKNTIRNSDRAHPKPRRALGTPGDLNAVTKASSFGRRLVANKKRLKKLEANLKKATS